MRRTIFVVLGLGVVFLQTLANCTDKPAPGGSSTQPATAPARLKITIGRDTTYVDGPVNPDGTINYLAAYNQRMSKGITPQNNAAVLLVQAIGPELFPKSIRAETLKRLGIAALPDKGLYFIRLADHAKNPDQADEQLAKAFSAVWSAERFPTISAWLKANDKPLALIVQAAKRPRYYHPAVSTDDSCPMIGVLLPSYSRVREAAKALTARAMLKWEQGNADGARADLLAVHQLGRLIAQDGTLIARLVAITIEAVACNAGQAMAAGPISAKQAKALLVDLQGLPPLPSMSTAINAQERFFGLDAIMMLARASLKGRGEIIQAIKGATGVERPQNRDPNDRPVPDILDWSEMLRMCNRWYDKPIAAGKLKTYPERRKAFAALDDEIRQFGVTHVKRMRAHGGLDGLVEKLGRSLGEERKRISQDMARVLLVILMPATARASELRDEVVMRLELTKVALALAEYKAIKGKYPEKLNELRPAYLRQKPKDLFADWLLIYDRTDKGYILYSLGPNMKDDGGKSRGQDSENYDIVVKVPAR